MVQKRIHLQTVVALMALALVGANVRAIEPLDLLGFKIGALQLKPQVGLAQRFDDNIYYRAVGVESDLVTVLSPGLNLQLGRDEGNMVQLGYVLDQSLYVDHPAEDALEHTISLLGRYSTDKTRFTGSYRYQDLQTILSGYNIGLSIGRIVQGANGSVQYSLTPKTSFYVEGVYSSMDFEEGFLLLDHTDYRGTLGFAHRAFKKISIFSEVFYGRTITDYNAPFEILVPFLLPRQYPSPYYGASIGARGDFGPRTTASIKTGYQIRTFDGIDKSSGAVVVETSFSQGIGNKSSVTLGYSRRDLLPAEVNQPPYTIDTLDARFNRLLGSSGRWNVSAGASYSVLSFEPAGGITRSDDSFRASVLLSYKPKSWLSTGLQYEFEQLSSNAAGIIDYQANRITLKLAVGY